MRTIPSGTRSLAGTAQWDPLTGVVSVLVPLMRSVVSFAPLDERQPSPTLKARATLRSVSGGVPAASGARAARATARERERVAVRGGAGAVLFLTPVE